MKVIFVLMDSMNRHYLPVYGNKWVSTPNIDWLAKKSVIFDNHWLGSAPCMPARRDLLTGRLNFLERNWNGLEPYDIPFTRLLRNGRIFFHMVTDHYYYFHPGGENYHAAFDTWEYIRGNFLPYITSRVINARDKIELSQYIRDTHLYNIESDPGQTKNLANTDIEKKYIKLLKKTMKEMDSPLEQYERLGLNRE